MKQQTLEDIATDGALLAEYLAQRGVPPGDVATIVAGAMPGIVAFETGRPGENPQQQQAERIHGIYGQTLEAPDDGYLEPPP
jgi:hypothetical protein